MDGSLTGFAFVPCLVCNMLCCWHLQ